MDPVRVWAVIRGTNPDMMDVDILGFVDDHVEVLAVDGRDSSDGDIVGITDFYGLKGQEKNPNTLQLVTYKAIVLVRGIHYWIHKN